MAKRKPFTAGRHGGQRDKFANYIHLDILKPKPLEWLGDSRDRVRDFPDAARHRTGFELWEVQQGNEPSDWKPMPSVGAGVDEIRVHVKGAYRVLYVARFAEAVYVLHAFGKKTQRTAKRDLDLATDRFGDLLKRRELAQRKAKRKQT